MYPTLPLCLAQKTGVNIYLNIRIEKNMNFKRDPYMFSQEDSFYQSQFTTINENLSETSIPVFI